MKNNGFNSSLNKSKTWLFSFFIVIVLVVVIGGLAWTSAAVVGSRAWNVSSAVWDGPGSNFSTTAQDKSPDGIFFSPTGTKMYITGATNATVYQYTLSQAWNTSTATYDGAVSDLNVSAQDTLPAGIFFSSTGTKMFIVGRTNSAVYQYTLSTPWQLNTSTWDGPNSNLSVVGQEETSLSGIFFNSTGTKMFIVDYGNDFVYQYTLSQAWDISTATYDGADSDLYIGNQEQLANGIFFNSTGTKMFINGWDGAKVYHYTLSQAWNTSTATYDGASSDFSTFAQDSIPVGLFFNSSGTKMFIVGVANNGTVYQYTLNCKEITFRSKGYWDNHPKFWEAKLPQTLGNEVVSNTTRVNQIFDRKTKIDKVKAPLLSIRFNLFDHPEATAYFVSGESITVSALADQADALLKTNATTTELTLMKDRLEKVTGKINSCSR